MHRSNLVIVGEHLIQVVTAGLLPLGILPLSVDNDSCELVHHHTPLKASEKVFAPFGSGYT